MGGFEKIFKKLEKKAEGLANELLGDDNDDDDDERKRSNVNDASFDDNTRPTRWEKSIVGLNGMVKQVSKVDPDGLDIVCFGGEKGTKPSIYRKVKNIKDVERMVTSELPSGPAMIGEAMDTVLKEAFDRGFKKRPCGILVLTAGRPDDSQRLEQSLQQAADRIAKKGYKKESPLSITFVQVGDDPKAEAYMKHLDENMTSKSRKWYSKTDRTVDIVDTIKDTDIQAAMKEIKGTQSTGTRGAIIGAIAGAAMGVGGLHLYNKQQAKKRTKGWNGTWKSTFDGEEIATLKVHDDLQGKLSIEGFPGGNTTGKYSEKRHGYKITFRDADENWIIEGDIEDEHTIFWNDGTVWEEIPPKGAKWTHYAGAAAAGAVTGGAIGYLLDKKFFKKAHKKDQADYVIVVDRSAKMTISDDVPAAIKDGEESKASSSSNNKEKPAAITDNADVKGVTHGIHNLLDTNTKKMAAGVAGVAVVATVAAVATTAVQASNKTSPSKAAVVVEPTGTTRSAGAKTMVGFNGRWRSTFDGEEIAVLVVNDDIKGNLTIDGFPGGRTSGNYKIPPGGKTKAVGIEFTDADERWPVKGDVKGTHTILWNDGTRWDKIG